MAASFEFKIIFESCSVDSFTASQRVGDITYNLGEPGLANVGRYAFVEDPVCNYDQTVSLTNLPSFVTHNKAAADFSLPQMSDLDLIGSYVVTMRSEIRIPDDHTATSHTTMFEEYDFTIFVEPCQVTSYSVSLEVVDISYNLGSAGLLNVGPYAFSQEPACGYSDVVTLKNLPLFVTHNTPVSSDFSIPMTSELALLGSYTVTVRSEI
jgi:hypothetical protein